MSDKVKQGTQMKHRESDILIVLLILRIISSEEKRRIHNTALDNLYTGMEEIMETKLARIAEISKERPKEVFSTTEKNHGRIEKNMLCIK